MGLVHAVLAAGAALLVANLTLKAAARLRQRRLRGGSNGPIGSLKNKHVVITGGSSGIGLAIAMRCAAEGAFLTLISRTPSKLTAAAELITTTLGCPSHRVQTKIADTSDADAIISALKQSFEWMPIDVLICNAGLAKPGMIGEVEVKDLDLVTKTNFLGCVYPIHAVVPLMKQRSLENPSSIVIMSSLAGLIPVYGVNVYSATKYALKGLAEVLYLELLPWNIHVNLICPSFTKTDLLAEEYFGANATICGVGKTLYSYNQQSLDSADHVAKITLEGIKAGRFLTFTNRQGSTLGPLGRGFIPSDSFSTFFLELLLMIPYRFLNVLWLLHSKKVIMSSMNSNMN